MIFIADLVNGDLPVPIFKVDPADGRLYWCRWASDGRLVCEIGSIVSDAGTLLGFSRLFAVTADGSKLVRLTAPTNSRTMGLMQYDVCDLLIDSLQRRMATMHSLYYQAVSTMDVEHVNHFEREGGLGGGLCRLR